MNPRVIPCLLLKGQGLVKTVKFQTPQYIGDPINAIRIFNDKQVDELLLLDITATSEQRSPNMTLIAEVASECFMPLAYGGGITSLSQIRDILKLGVEKVVLNHAAIMSPQLIKQASDEFGSQAIVVAMDVKRKLFGRYEVYKVRGTKSINKSPLEFAEEMESLGAGELFINSIDRDGTMTGYDLELISSVAKTISIPVIACGGASSLNDFYQATTEGGASAVAAGAFFVFHGKHRGVLITYPDQDALSQAFAGHHIK